MNDATITVSTADNSGQKRPISPEPVPKYPYPGLRPFKTEEVAIFYGRNAQKDAILERLNQSRMVFILGSSGCGKSSLIKAGVIPALKAGLLTKQGYDWRVIAMRPGRRPLVNLADAFSHARQLESERVKPESAEGQAEANPVGDQAASGVAEFLSSFENEDEGLWPATSMLPDALREGSRKNTARYLLLVDQFEEIFGGQIKNSAEVDHFVKLLTAQYARPHPALYVIFTMRSDYLGNCSSFPGLSEAVNNCSYLTPILAESEIREAIERPARDYGASVEDQLVEQILAEMHAGTNYNSDNLPLMQHALLWLWQKAKEAEPKGRRDSNSRMLLAAKDYQAFGGLKGILNKHADETLKIAAGKGPECPLIAEGLFRRLSERDEQGRFRRCPATFAEIKKIAACRDDELERVVSPFADEKASFIEDRKAHASDERLLDVSHEAMIRGWDQWKKWAIQERQKYETFGEYLRSASAWRDSGQNSKSLEGQPNLGEFERWWKASKPTGSWFGRYFDPTKGNYSSADDAVAWVDRYRLASLKADRFRKWRMRVVEALAVALAVFVPSYVAYTAHVNGQKLRAQAIALRAEYALDREGPAKALLFAEQAEKQGLPDLPRTERVLVSALKRLRERRVIAGLSNPISGVAYSPDGRVIASLDNGSLRFWDAKDGELLEKVQFQSDVTGNFGLTWSAKADWIGVNLRNKTLLLRPCAHAKIRPLFPSCQSGDPDQSIILGDAGHIAGLPKFSDDGKWLVTGTWGELPALWDIATKSATPLGTKKVATPNDVAISPDTKTIALGFENAEIHLIDRISGNTQIMETGSDKASNVLALAFNPNDPNMLAVSLQNGEIIVWDLNLKTYITLTGTGGIAHNVTFSRDGKTIASSSDDKVIRTWTVGDLSGRPTEFRGHSGPAYWVAYSPDGKSLVSGSADKTIRIWDQHSPLWPDVKSGQPLEGPRLTEPPQWSSSIRLPPSFGLIVAYARQGDRGIVASRTGELAMFLIGADPEPIARWRSPKGLGDIASLRLEHDPDRIIVVTKTGSQVDWPFFASVHELVKFADDHLPFDGTRRQALTKDELCTVSAPDGQCSSSDVSGGSM
jgi:WD40 repeat protein/energy-coupling factor transporter ATP-binding protein EcfA2